MDNSSRYVLILWDRHSNGQITATFRDLNSIDQVTEGVARQMKNWQEAHGSKIDTKTNIEDVIKKYVG